MSATKWSLTLCLLVTLCGPAAHAQSADTIINAADCTPAALNTAWGQMSSGAYIIQLPNPCPTSIQTTQWKPANVPAAVTSVTIQGSTTVSCTGTAGTSNYTCVATDNTVLTDQYPSSGNAIWYLNVGSIPFRVTGITFKGGTLASGNNKYNGFIQFGGSSQALRVDHCHFNTHTYSAAPNFGGGMTIYSIMYGVIDHNLFDQNGVENAVRDYGGGDANGDVAWTQPTQLGSANFIFAENNVFNGGFVNDCNNGATGVFRYNTVLSDSNDSAADSGGIQGHEQGQGTQRLRGCRALERYHNYFNNPTPSFPEYSTGDGGSGTGVIWAETIGTGFNFGVIFQQMREVSTGHTQTDVPNGIGYCGSASNGHASPWDGNSGLHSGGWPCIGQTGRGQGDALSGNFPTLTNTTIGCTPNAATAPPSCSGWPHQKLEPWYVWMFTGYTNALYGAPAWNGVSPNNNLDFFVTNTGCEPNGCSSLTTGVGWGTLAQRPTSCTAGPGGPYGISPTGSYGVGYWATDANNGVGELYVCTAINTWTAVYEPYTYPHPLVAGGPTEVSGNAPSAPTGLVATIE